MLCLVSRWTSNTTPEQKAAAIEALCDREISAPRVSAMAAKGQLAGLKPFDISPSSCRRLRTAENSKRDRARRMSPEHREQTIEELESRLIAVMADAVALIETGQKSTVPLGQVRTLLATLRELQTGHKARRAKPAPGQERQTQSQGDTGGTLVSRLRTAAAGHAGGEAHQTTASPARSPLSVVGPDPAA